MTEVVTRFKQPRAPKKRKPKAAHKRPGMSAAYLAAIRRLPSCITGRTPCEAHHLRCAGGRGVGLKAEDKWALPLTFQEHVAGVDCVHSVGAKLEFKWFQDRGVNCLDLAVALWTAFPDEAKMLRVLNAHMVYPSNPTRKENGKNHSETPKRPGSCDAGRGRTSEEA
jgi:hypothetical protein